MLAALGKSGFGLCAVIGVMMAIELLAYTMIMFRDGIVTVMNVRQTYTVKNIQKGLTLLNLRMGKDVKLYNMPGGKYGIIYG